MTDAPKTAGEAGRPRPRRRGGAGGEGRIDQTGLTRRDFHVHTRYCRHARGSMREYVEAAVALGLEEIGFLEHVEAQVAHPQPTWLTPDLLDVYWHEGLALQSEFAGVIRVSLGVEAGASPDRPGALLELLRRHPWERVGLSCHFVWDDLSSRHLNLFSRHDPEGRARLLEIGAGEVLPAYFGAIRDFIPLVLPDMLCHLDATDRTFSGIPPDSGCSELVEGVLLAAKAAGAAVELNTAGYAYRGSLYPSAGIIRRAAELGIGFMMGSDSHDPAEVGRFFDRAAADLRAAVDVLGQGG